ncbi:MAG: hypothetical protein IJT97_09435, partial [Bacteroidaceae bacterium]|nr:hypothetical protein [Bacteroidaceae bacterium]
KAPAKNVRFLIYDTSNYWAEPYIHDLAASKEAKIDLRQMMTKSGRQVDPSHIRIAGFCSAGADQKVYVTDMFLSMDGVNPGPAPEPPVTIEQITELIDKYLQDDASVTIQDITELIDKYLEQGGEDTTEGKISPVVM